MQLQGRHVLVTGASRGVGQSIAEVMARRGARLTLVARSADKLQAVADGVGAAALPTDLTDPEAVGALPEAAEQANGPVDVLVNNAAISIAGPFSERSAAEVRDMLEINLLAPVELSRAIIPGMVDRGRGAIVNIGSFGSELPLSNFATYGIAKAGLASATHTLHRELRGTGVHCSLLVVGLLDTDMTQETMRNPSAAPILKRFEKLRLISPDDVAERVAVLAETGRPVSVMPWTAVPMVRWRMAPSYLSDLLLRGLTPSGSAPPRTPH